MLYIILLVCFIAIIMAFLMIYVPLKEGYRKADEKAQASVARELDEMFVFIPVDYLGYIKFGCLIGFGLLVFILTFNRKQPGPYLAGGLAAAVGDFAAPAVRPRLLPADVMPGRATPAGLRASAQPTGTFSGRAAPVPG